MEDNILNHEPKTVSFAIPGPLIAILKLYGPQIKKLAKDAAEAAIDALFSQIGVD